MLGVYGAVSLERVVLMARIQTQHGRRGQETEYVEWRVVMPRVVVQKYGGRWLLNVTHVDGTWHVACYFDDLGNAKRVAEKLITAYSTAVHPCVSDDVKLAKEIVEQYGHLTTAAAREGARDGHHC